MMTVTSDNEGWHVYFPKGRKDFLSGIADGGTTFYYYEGREDSLEWVCYDSGFVSFYNGKPRGFICFWEWPRKGDGDLPLWIKEYDWQDRWYHKNYEIGEHNYSISSGDSMMEDDDA